MLPVVRRVSILVVATLIAGCLAGPEPDGAAKGGPTLFELEWAERAVAAGQGHDHRNPQQHEGRSTDNFEIVGWNPLITDYHSKTAGGYLCGDVRERSGRSLSAIHSWVSDVAFLLVDVTDPTKPTKIGELALPNTHVYDLGMTPDQRFVLLATTSQGMGTDPTLVGPGPGPSFLDECTGERRPVDGPEQNVPYQSGVVLVDIRNPRQPVVADYLYLAGGHSMQVEQLGTRTFALVTTQTFSLLEVVPRGDSAKLLPASIFAGCTGTTPICGYHDGALQTHPVTKQNLAYLGSGGFTIFNIDDPSRPRIIGTWNDWSSIGSKVTHTFTHEILPMKELWDGRHYTFIGEECGGRQAHTPTCLVVILDTTDPTKPSYVGAWTLPVETGAWRNLLFSLHYVGVSNGTLFVANYHGGLWAVDVSTPEAMRTMPTIGVFVPSNVSPKPVGRSLQYDTAPAVLDVNPMSDGTLITYDHTSGLYALRFDRDRPAPAPAPWPFD